MGRTGKQIGFCGRLQKIVLFLATALVATVAGQSAVPVVTGNSRVDKLLSQMTLEKKWLLSGAHERIRRQIRARRDI